MYLWGMGWVIHLGEEMDLVCKTDEVKWDQLKANELLFTEKEISEGCGGESHDILMLANSACIQLSVNTDCGKWLAFCLLLHLIQ